MTAARHLEFLIEEPSTEAFVKGLLPRVLPEGRVLQGKNDMLRKLESRLLGCGRWSPARRRPVVVVDRDQDAARGPGGTAPAERAYGGLRAAAPAPAARETSDAH